MERLPKYLHLRGLELEGRWPLDVGGWPVTIRRIEMGWGAPTERNCPEINFVQGEPYPPAPYVDPSLLKPHRIDFYYRVRTSSDCICLLQQNRHVPPGL